MKKYPLIILLFIITNILSAFANGNPPFAPQANKTSITEAVISGQIMIKDKIPMANGVLFLFSKSMGPPPSQDKYWRVPDLISPLDEEGRFSIDIPEGTYYLTAAQKDSEGELGPPMKAELYYFHGDGEGNPQPLNVGSGAKMDLGVLSGTYLWSPQMIKREGVTEINGAVADLEGKPVGGALVFAYLNEFASGRPVFISERTDQQGRYRLVVHGGGKFYLKVRSVYGGGAPETGEFLNITEEFKPFSVTVLKDQKLQGANLKVKRFPPRGLKNPGAVE